MPWTITYHNTNTQCILVSHGREWDTQVDYCGHPNGPRYCKEEENCPIRIRKEEEINGKPVS